MVCRAAKKTEQNTSRTKDLVGESFRILLGIQKLDAQDLPDYPMSIGEGKDKWRKYPATRKDLILVLKSYISRTFGNFD